MKIVLVAGCTLLCFVFLHLTKSFNRKKWVMAAYVGVMILLFAFYNYRTVELILPMYHPTDQTMYQKEFIDTGAYPDAILPYILEGKTIYVKDDYREDEQNNALETGEAFNDEGKYWMYAYHHTVNETNFLKACKAEVVPDKKLNNVVLDGDIIERFEDLGMINDLFRYTFLLANDNEEWWNAFYYYWYYSCYMHDIDNEGMHMYICADGIKDADELVLLWTENESEDLYLMTKAFYDKEVGML